MFCKRIIQNKLTCSALVRFFISAKYSDQAGYFDTALSLFFPVYSTFHLYPLDCSVFAVYYTTPVFNCTAEK